jgi:hypothetical protein
MITKDNKVTYAFTTQKYLWQLPYSAQDRSCKQHNLILSGLLLTLFLRKFENISGETSIKNVYVDRLQYT